MGSPLSPIIADLYMEQFERDAIQSSENKQKIWLRYVDDIFSICEHGREALEKFLSHLNSHRNSIKFSMEVEMNGCLPFLDVTIHKERNKLYTSVYRKPTRTDRYLNYNSYHHPKIKSGRVKSLAHRARTRGGVLGPYLYMDPPMVGIFPLMVIERTQWC